MDDKTLIPIIIWAVNIPAILVGGFFLLIGGYYWIKGAFDPRPSAGIGIRLIVTFGISLFMGLMVATAGGAAFPKIIEPAAAYICDGKITRVSQEYSYKPGQHGISHNIYCVSADGKQQTITIASIGAAALMFSLLIFATYFIPALLMLPFTLRKHDSDMKPRPFSTQFSGKSTVTTTINGRKISGNVDEVIQDFLGEQSSEDVRQAVSDTARQAREKLVESLNGRIINLNNAAHRDIAARLNELKSLHDKGLINTLEYEKKRQEIIAEL